MTEAQATEIGVTRNQAIVRIVEILTHAAISEGAKLAQVIGPEAAAEITAFGCRLDLLALKALGVTEDEIKEAFAQL